jgi:sugar fermentation stimulation protein A
MPPSLVGINTLVPNRLVKQAILQGRLQDFLGYETIRSEVPYGQYSRIDLLLEKKGKKCFIEIKNCTLVEDGIAYFPDAVTSRGLKHLRELENIVREKKRGVMFYLVQRMDAKVFKPAIHIDPAYGKALKHAAMRGVEIVVYDVTLDLKGISLRNRLPYRLSE